MSTFVYTARDGRGAAVTGTLAAESAHQVMQMLRADGKYPVNIRPLHDTTAGPAARSPRGIKVPRVEVVQVATQLSIMLETGVTLAEALDCIATQCHRPALKALVTDLSQQVQSGTDFSTALACHPRSFGRLFLALVRASERSGMMPKLLARGAAYMRDEQETVRKVKGALIYPAIMLGFAVTTTIFLLAFVLPRFTSIYASKAAALPTPTRLLMAASNFLIEQWLPLVGGIAAAAVLGFFYFRSAGGRRTWHTLQLRSPLMGPMFRQLNLARGLRMLGTMAGAGVNLVDCVQIVRGLCSNTHFQDLWTEVEKQIQAGKQLSEPLFQNPLVPRSVCQMLHSGERSGKLSYVMEQVAGYSEQELKEKISNMTRYIEPVMIIIMGCIIGGVALSLLLPVFTISRVMSAH